MKKPKPKSVALVYIGRRIFDSDKGRIAKAFCVFGKWEKIIYFPHVKWATIGGYYQATTTNGRFQMERSPNHAEGPKPKPELIEEWEVEDLKAESFKKRVFASRLAEKKAKEFAKEFSHNARTIVKKLSWFERRTFVDSVCDELEKLDKK